MDNSEQNEEKKDILTFRVAKKFISGEWAIVSEPKENRISGKQICKIGIQPKHLLAVLKQIKPIEKKWCGETRGIIVISILDNLAENKEPEKLLLIEGKNKAVICNYILDEEDVSSSKERSGQE